MAEQTPTRRSGRGRIPNRRYEDEAIEKLNQVLSSDSEDDAALQNLQEDVSVDDEEFKSGAHASVDSVSDVMSAEEGSHSSAIRTPEEEVGDEGNYADAPVIQPSTDHSEMPRAAARPWKKASPKAETRSRGVSDNPISGLARSSRLGPLSGPGQADQYPVLQSMRQWGDDPTLPSRSKLRYHFVHTEEKRQREATAGWKWYEEDGGKVAFSASQTIAPSNSDEIAKSSSNAEDFAHEVLLGPYGHQHLFRINGFDILEVGSIWKPQASQEQQNDGNQVQYSPSRTGWVLNAGGRLRSLAWAPNHNGDQQYLALATQTQKPTKSNIAPSFQPNIPSPSSIQIWGFRVHDPKTSEDGVTSRDDSARLILHLRHQWGDAKQLKWCPMPRDPKVGETKEEIPIGLLASVFDDGHVRVLDLRIDRRASIATAHYQIKSPAVTIVPLEKTICTCICWLSQTDIAVGHSNGYLCVFSIDPNYSSSISSKDRPSTPDAEPSADPTSNPLSPWLISRIHQTYITSITPAYPSLPNIIASTSISGHMRLTSLNQPSANYVLSRRSHMPPMLLIYHPALYGCVFPEDSREMISFSGLRFWGNNIQIGEATGSGGVAALDVGTCHPCVAWGGADGRVMITNPMRKVMRGTEKVWQICVFRQDWVRKPELKAVAAPAPAQTIAEDSVEEGPATSAAPKEFLPPGKRGHARITEGYKIQQADVDRNPSGRSIVTGVGRHGKGNMTLTIYEEETGVTAVAWNPNLSCGGWLAAAWGSGLVRIEDLAI